MENISTSQIIQSNPIGEGLNAVRESLSSICDDLGTTSGEEALSKIRGEGSVNSPRFFPVATLTCKDLRELAGTCG